MPAVRRFQVMAMLQAARAEALGLPGESALSWGLNRAIFIAAAKRGFRGGGEGEKGAATSKDRPTYSLGDDMAYTEEREGVLLFTIGGEVQTVEAFDRQVRSRLGESFGEAWRWSVDYISSFPKETLLSSRQFFSDVYRPVRDELARRWTEAAARAKGRKRSV